MRLPRLRRAFRGAPAALALAGAVPLLGLLGACSSHKTPPALVVDAGAAAAGLTAEQSAQVLARVGDRTITLGDFASALEHMDEFDRLRYGSPARRRELLSQMIDVMLLADEARAKGYDKDPAAEQEVREILRDAVLQRARATVPSPADIPNADVEAYYAAHKADFRDPERRRVSAIVTRSQAAAAAALEAATHASPEGWGELVKSKSVEPPTTPDVPADLAGDLGFVSPPGDPRGVNPRVPEDVRAAAFTIEHVGDVLKGVVAAGGKFYVVKLAGKVDAHERTLADVERTVRVKLAQDQMRAAEDALLADLRKRFPVEVDQAALAQVKVDLPADGGAP